jgi:hypothetical protein
MLRTFAWIEVGAFALAVTLACSKKQAHETGSPAEGAAPAASAALSASAAPASAEVAALPAESEALSGLDTCVIGTWKAQWVKMKVGSMNAEGGANPMLTIAESGTSVIDFTPMSKVQATTPGFAFDFQYAGKAIATLKTPKRGVLEAENAIYSSLRVTASATAPQTKPITILKNKPLTELATAASAFATTHAAPPTSGAPGVPEAAQATSGIDESPVFSSATYTCADSALMLYSKNQDVTWRFVKAEPR